MSAEKQKRILKKCPDILVATPGRLWELVEQVSAWLIAKVFFNDGYTKCFDFRFHMQFQCHRKEKRLYYVTSALPFMYS